MRYKSNESLAEILDCDERTVRRIVKEMQKSGRYPPETFLVRLKRVDLDAVLDYCGKEKE